jgi:uncharacterized membrane-anchored protein
MTVHIGYAISSMILIGNFLVTLTAQLAARSVLACLLAACTSNLSGGGGRASAAFRLTEFTSCAGRRDSPC